MRGVNKIFVLGRLGRDPETRNTTSGTMVANFSVAVEESFKARNGEWEKRTEWINIVCFGRTAENAGDYLRKGSKVFVEGKIRTEKWQDKNGNDRYTTKVYADNMQYLDDRRTSGDEHQPSGRSAGPGRADTRDDGARSRQPKSSGDDEQPEFDDDIPF